MCSQDYEVVVVYYRLGFSVWKRDVSRAGQLIQDLVETGIDHVEIDIDSILDLEDREWLRELAGVLYRENMTIGVHAPWKELYIASPVEEVREASVKILTRLVRALRDTGIDYEYIVLHPSSEQPVCTENTMRCLESLKRSLEGIMRETERVVVETIQGRCCGRAEQIDILLDMVPGLSVCLDLAHVIAENIKTREFRTVADAIELVSRKVLEKTMVLHLHGLYIERDKRVKTHRDFSITPLGETSLVERIRDIQRLRYIVFEVFYNREGRDARPLDIRDEVSRVRRLVDVLRPSL